MHKKCLDKFKICDSEILLEFVVLYSRFEFSLKRADFLKDEQNAKANWNVFIKKIEDEFDKDKNTELENAEKYLLEYPAKQQIINNNKLDFSAHPTTSSSSEITRIYNCIRITRNNLFHGGKYSNGQLEGTERNKKLLQNSIIILKEFLKLDPKVEKAFWNIE